MSESGDYTPAPHWSGYDYASARKSYADDVVKRGAVDPVAIGITELVPEKIVSNSETPLIITIDVTGSMGKWPTTIFEKLPFFEHEVKSYLGPDAEICFVAIGDHVQKDSYPLQVHEFAKERGLEDSLKKIIFEGGGGGDQQESYELAAAYFAENCSCPNSLRKPLMIIIGDEGIHSVLNKDDAKRLCKVELDEAVATPKVLFAKLRKKFEVYIIRKPYGASSFQTTNSTDNTIQRQWEDLLGADHVICVPEPERVVDVIYGILGDYTGKFDEFVKELKERQGKDSDGNHKIEVVMNSLKSLKSRKLEALPPPAKANSITRKSRKIDPPASSLGGISLADDE
jgi:hypothetical protein